MGKAAFVAPLYISFAWSLIISYQLFTQTAVCSLTVFIASFWPSIAESLLSRVDTITFIHAFAWIFVLSSVIPSFILGKGRSVLIQFFLCLILTLVAVSAEEILTPMLGTGVNAQIQRLSVFFQNHLIAGIYLSLPYLFMLYLDIRSRRKSREEKQLQETEETEIIEEYIVEESPEAEDSATVTSSNNEA